MISINNFVLMFHWYWLLLFGIVPVAVYGNHFPTNAMGNCGTKKPGDYTIVFFGAHSAVVLASLLSDDGQLVIKQRFDMVSVVNSTNAAWTPDPKYHICNEIEPARIAKRLHELTGPFRFVVTFYRCEMWLDGFWSMIYYLAYYKKTYTSTDEVKMVVMDIPNDGIPLQQHSDDMKRMIMDDPHYHFSANVSVTGMHLITKSGPVSEMQELEQELIDIKREILRTTD